MLGCGRVVKTDQNKPYEEHGSKSHDDSLSEWIFEYISGRDSNSFVIRDSAAYKCFERGITFRKERELEIILALPDEDIIINPLGLERISMASFLEKYGSIIRGADIREELRKEPIIDMEGRPLKDSCIWREMCIKADKYSIHLMECEGKCHPPETRNLAEGRFMWPDTFKVLSMRIRDPRFRIHRGLCVGMTKGQVMAVLFPKCEKFDYDHIDSMSLCEPAYGTCLLFTFIGDSLGGIDLTITNLENEHCYYVGCIDKKSEHR